MITTPEIICDLFSFLDKDMIERIQIVNQFWNKVIIRHKNILPLREFDLLEFENDEISLDLKNYRKIPMMQSYAIKFDGTNLRKGKRNVSSLYSQLTVDEVLNNLNDVVFHQIKIRYGYLDNLLNMMKLVTTKTGGRFRARFGYCYSGRYDSKLAEIFDNYIIVDELILGYELDYDSYIREICANPEIVQLPSTPKEIRLPFLELNENDEVLHFTCNGKLNGANRVTIVVMTHSNENYGNFIRQWFELYLTHQNPISLVGKFVCSFLVGRHVLDAVKTLLNNTQLRVKYSLETKEFYDYIYGVTHFLNRSCVLHETDSYALVIEMAYRDTSVANMSSINASDLDQPPCDKMERFSLCVKSL